MSGYSENTVSVVVVICLVLGLLIGLFFGAIFGRYGADMDFRHEAVRKGHARWTIDAEGNKGWEWIDHANQEDQPRGE